MEKQNISITIPSNAFEELIKNPNSLSVWTYLKSQDDLSRVSKLKLPEMLGMGTSRFNAAFKKLVDLKLVKFGRNKGNDGRYTLSTIYLLGDS